MDALIAGGDAHAAADALDRLIRSAPADADLHARMVQAQLSIGRPDRASVHAAAALRLGPPEGALLHRMVALLGHVALPPGDDALRTALADLLERTDVDADALSTAVTRMLVADPAFGACLAAPERTLALGGALGRLVMAWLSHAPIAHPRVERWLMDLRATLGPLLLQDSPANHDDALEMACALARQAWLCQHAWSADDRDAPVVQRARDVVGASPDTSRAWAALAMHAPLHDEPGHHVLLERTWPAPFESVVACHLREPMEEAALRARITRHVEDLDDVGDRVRAQYEAHPYPRWNACPVPEPSTPATWLRTMLPGYQPPAFLEHAPHILVAGCGTGRHALLLARRFPAARVLGLDLSMASLAYARRVADRLGHAQLDLQQADLRFLSGHWPSFHLVESVGVIHHMADPAEGLAALCNVVVRGGVLCLGVYSRAARHAVNAAREKIRSWGLQDPSPANIRAARRRLMDLPREDPAWPITWSPDFHSMSGCRDLLFHAQEIQFTLPLLGDLLRRFPLELLGLEPPGPSAAARFDQRFPGRSRADLGAWALMEQEDPDLFAGMYVAWCQRL